MIIHDSEFQAKANVAYTSTHTKLLSWEGGQEETILEAQERTTERTTCGQQVYKCYPLEIKTSLTHSLTHRQTILFTHTTSGRCGNECQIARVTFISLLPEIRCCLKNSEYQQTT